MKVEDIFEDFYSDSFCELEEVYVDENDEILSETAVRQWRRRGTKLVKKYRCLSGPKKNKIVSKPGDCGVRKDPKRVRLGKKIMRSKKGAVKRKSKIAKKRSISKILQKLNARLMGKTPPKNTK